MRKRERKKGWMIDDCTWVINDKMVESNYAVTTILAGRNNSIEENVRQG